MAGAITTLRGSRTFALIALLARFFTLQVVLQVVSVGTGFLIIRFLDQGQYAIFTVANTMVGSMTYLADAGLIGGILTIGGRVWRSKVEFGALIKTALQLRYWVGALVGALLLPVTAWLLYKNGANGWVTSFATIVIAVSYGFQLDIAVLSAVPRLLLDAERLQRFEIMATVIRLMLVFVLGCAVINASLLLVTTVVAFAVQLQLLKKYTRQHVDMSQASDLGMRRELVGLMRPQLGMFVLVCAQAPVTTWLLSLCGNVSSVAEVGALGRVGAAIAVTGSLVSAVIAPRFARMDNHGPIILRYLQSVGVFVGFSALLLLVVHVAPRQVIWVLGSRYSHLQSELLILVSSTLLPAFAGLLCTLNTSRGWISYAWLFVPATLLTQVVLLLCLRLDTPRNVLIFNLVSACPSACIQMLAAADAFGTLMDNRRICSKTRLASS